MWIFILAIFLSAYLQTIVKLSILRRLYRWGVIILCSLSVLCVYPLATRINLKAFNAIMSDFNTLSTVCAAVIIQEALVLLFGTILLRRHYLGMKIPWYGYAVLLPSGLYPAGMFFLLVWGFNTFSGIGFIWSAIGLTAGTALLTVILTELPRLLIKEPEQMVQTVAMPGLAQIALAMFLPVILSGRAPSGSLVTFDIKSAAGICALAALTALLAAVSHIFHRCRKLIIKHRRN